MAKITYEDKEFLNKNEDIADNRKVNDTDLNQIKEIVNNNFDEFDLKNNILTAEMSQEQLSISDNVQIPLTVSQSVGSEITLSDNVITISDKIKKVKVSATFNAQMPTAGNVYGQLDIRILDGGRFATGANASDVGQYNFFEMNITPKIIDVSISKQLWLNAYLSRQGTAHNDEYGNCYITVEAVE